MDSLDLQLESTRKSYREFFIKFADEINRCVYDVKPDDIEGEIFDSYPENSSGKAWQISVLKLIEEGIAPDIFKKLIQLKEYRKTYDDKCSGCASCCKLAVSEFSPEELKNKAENGDEFSKQFLSVFVPYSSIEEAEKIYPEYINLLQEKSDEKVYFYHCPKVTSDNRCPDYENRPQICRDYPDNPFAFLHEKCAYKKWKNEVLQDSLKLQAMVEIIEFYKSKLKNNN